MNATRQRLRTAIAAFALLAACASQALAQVPAERIERVTDQLVELLPVGSIMDEFAAKDPTWPLRAKAASTTPGQLACVRQEMSSAGYRKHKLAEVRTYAAADPVRFESDAKLLEQGVATLLGRMVTAGADEARTGVKPDPSVVMRGATPDQLLAMTSFMFEPKYKALRDLSGFGEMFDLDKSADERRKQGMGVGAALMMKMLIRSISGCGIPATAIF